MLSETGPASRAKIVALLDDLLPAGLSDRQKSKRVSNLLAKMKNVDKTVDNDGVIGKAARWRAIQPASPYGREGPDDNGVRAGWKKESSSGLLPFLSC